MKTRRRGQRFYLPMAEDLVGGREVERNDQPFLLLRTAGNTPMGLVQDTRSLVGKLEDDWTPTDRGLLNLAVLVLGVGGCFDLYDEAFEGGSPEWPRIDPSDLEGSLDALEVRVGVLRKLCADDIAEAMETASKSAALSRAEEGNSAAPSA